MEILTRRQADVTILEVRGKMTIGFDETTLHEAVLEALEAGSRKILVHLEGVTTIDSTGVGQLVHSLTSVDRRQGDLKLLRPSPRVADVFRITRLDLVFQIFDDEDAAVESFL
jgi:anti-sigma B factor antagonist